MSAQLQRDTSLVNVLPLGTSKGSDMIALVPNRPAYIAILIQ